MYKIRPKEIPKAALMLGQAFENYPLFKYVLPNSVLRIDQLKHFCRFLLRFGMTKGMVIAPSRALEGVSIWIPSEQLRHSAMDAVRSGLFNLLLHVNSKALGRFIEIGKFKAQRRADLVQGSYWLCDMIGVDPQVQGRGLGRQMIEAQLKCLEKAEVPCYLETSEQRNVGYYQKYGFDLIHQYEFHGVPVFCLQWKPDARRETLST